MARFNSASSAFSQNGLARCRVEGSGGGCRRGAVAASAARCGASVLPAAAPARDARAKVGIRLPATDAGSGDALCHADLFLAAELR